MATKIGLLTQEVTAQNPWWRDSQGWAVNDLDLREAHAFGLSYHARALDSISPGCLYLLRGPGA